MSRHPTSQATRRKPSPRFALRPTAVAVHLLLAGAAIGGWVGAAQAQPATAASTRSYNIPAGPLNVVLTRFLGESGVLLSGSTELAQGKQSPGVQGNLTPKAGLAALLAGTGLQAVADAQGRYVLRVAPVDDKRGEATLPTVTVKGDISTQHSHLAYLSKRAASGALGTKSVLDTPFSITVVDNNEIIERGAKSIGQIFFSDPSVYTPTPSFNVDWWGTRIRGLPVRNTYVDDISMVLSWGGDFPTEVIDSVSALKGLTGFMYGFGTPGGALSYQLKRPSQTPETSLSVGYRNPKLFTAHVDTSHNIDGDLAIRANFATEQGTAYNTSEINRNVVSLAVDKQLGGSLLWQTTLVYEDSKIKGEPFQFYLSEYDVAGSGGRMPTPTYDYRNININNAYYKTETLLASTGVKWQIDDQWKLDYQLGFSRKNHRSNKAFADLLNSAGDYSGGIYNFAGRHDTLFTQAMLQGTVSAFGMKHELVAGLGLQKTETSYSNFRYPDNDFQGNIHVSQPYRVSHTLDFSLNPASPEVVQKNVFLSDTVHFNERWQAIAGLRFTDYHNKAGYRTRETTPTLALIYKPDAQTSLYGSYVEGLEPGSRVGDIYANAGELLPATISKQAEVGIKGQANTFDYSAAIFRIERANQIDVVRGGERYRTQDGLVLYQGAELSGAYQFTRNLNLGMGATYLDATIDKVSAASAAIEGNTPANAPKWQVVGHAQYKVPNISGLSIHGAARYFGATYNDNKNLLTVPSRTIVNAGFSYDFDVQGHALTLIGNINNVFNKKYWASGGWEEGSSNIGEARNVSLVLRAQF
ncbi:TonB-dependent siderophore receptor [Thauera mechernichensis]|uniref:TonB-dependent siderophore receptor n=1 Tax=Thauera mechernichensis TaxID=82788 RepID=A0ABW3WF57_9RHOO|nr:TonB-dependent receptor [Thauera sp. 27]ENO81380.1 tonB-dependent ferric siderophore receptor protein [Thauera sp. 27]